MKSAIRYVALNVQELDWYVELFQSAFGMTVAKAEGTAPYRKVWFAEGIQLCECVVMVQIRGQHEHITIAVEDVAAVKAAAKKAGCRDLPDGENWFALPNYTHVELVEL